MPELPLDQQRPIHTGIKSKRMVWREPENPVRWAYAKILRENNQTQRIFPVDPYVEVYQFRENVYGLYTHSLDGMGDPWMYLVIGPQKALLIDTSFGVGNLKGLVEQLTNGMPLIVVCTHASYDHSYGNFPFGRVYCHEYEVPKMQYRNNPHIWDYLFDERGKCIWTMFDPADIVPYQNYEIIGCPNGTRFDLGGGHEVEMVFLPGHSAGHAAYLDLKNRILFAGDDACVGSLSIGGCAPGDPYKRYATVTALRNELRKVVRRRDEFDAVFPGHGPVDLSTIVLDNVLEACEKVVADPECADAKAEIVRNGVRQLRYKKMIYLSGYLEYTLQTV